ncbi:MAG: site-specific DNA-methyltransferase, partial [Anaerolineae bacterium]|nr:site-specific DNA-methyltransferase [Anaerolineae bacterium]
NFKRYDIDGEHSVTEISDADNLIIKGNNLLALHSLKKTFAGKVKLIYIDPPYNTGKDGFNYNDRFNHSTWLTFIKNRLEIARELLSGEGVIFVQITDYEQAYLKILLDDIFGRDNFLECIVWQKRNGPPNDKIIGAVHEYILVYAKNIITVRLFLKPRSRKQIERYTNPDNHSKGPWASGDLMANVKGGRYVKSLYYPIINPNTGEEVYPSSGGNWRFNKEEMQRLLDNDEIYWGEDGKGRPKLKRFLSDVRDGVSFSTMWNDGFYSHTGTNEIRAMFGGMSVFDTPKPEKLIQRILQLGSQSDDLVLDFFAGSGTTAAVAHKMGRQFIAIEQMDYTQTITTERLKKVIGQRVMANDKLFEEIVCDQGGISNDVDWQGGGSFVYCELMQWNQRYIDQIETASTPAELQSIWQEMQQKTFLSYRLDVKQFDEHAADFAVLSLDDQKKFLLEVLDKNQLYVNLSEMNDVTYGVSEINKTLNRQFYGLE